MKTKVMRMIKIAITLGICISMLACACGNTEAEKQSQKIREDKIEKMTKIVTSIDELKQTEAIFLTSEEFENKYPGSKIEEKGFRVFVRPYYGPMSVVGKGTIWQIILEMLPDASDESTTVKYSIEPKIATFSPPYKTEGDFVLSKQRRFKASITLANAEEIGVNFSDNGNRRAQILFKISDLQGPVSNELDRFFRARYLLEMFSRDIAVELTEKDHEILIDVSERLVDVLNGKSDSEITAQMAGAMYGIAKNGIPSYLETLDSTERIQQVEEIASSLSEHQEKLSNR